MISNRPSAARLRARFADRPDLGREAAIGELWASLPADRVAELAELVEEEFSISFGLLRPDDNMARLTGSLEVGNPLTWLWAEAALEDAVSELNYRFAKRGGSRRQFHTIRDLVEAWCEASRLTSA
jgi:hypothetical protein